MSSQSEMETFLQDKISEIYREQNGQINEMIRPEFIACSYENRTTDMAYPVRDWELNRYGRIHGGAVTAIMDNAMALMGMFFSSTGMTTTVSTELKFLRPALPGDRLRIHTEVVHLGRRLLHMRSTATSEKTGKPIATCAAVFMPIAEDGRSDT